MADALAAMPAPVIQPWSKSTSRIARELKGKLRILRDGQLVAFDPGERPEPEFYLVYFSAHWCGPCRRFTPRLIDAYRDLKAGPDGDRFELIFISHDESALDQSKYVKETGMPWPFVRFKSLDSVESLERWEGNGIPCLVVVSADGHAIFHSYQGNEYLGPSDPLKRFTAMLGFLRSEVGSAAPKVHRLAVYVHVRKQKEDCGPRRYRVIGDGRSFASSGLDSVAVVVEVGADGCVASARVDAGVGDFAAVRLRTEASSWLFLPAMRGGVPVESSARVVIDTRSKAGG